jgi:CcmD family protein
MDAPADTLNYMIAGFTVIFGGMGLYVASLVVRMRRLKQEQADLETLDES